MSSSPTQPSRMTQGLAAAVIGVAAFVLCGLALRGPVQALTPLDHYPGVLVDFGIYRAQAEMLLQEQQSLVDEWLYPPAAALLFLGFGNISETLARAYWGVLQLLFVALLATSAAQSLGRMPRGLRVACALGLTCASLPVLHCLKWGQLSSLIVLLSLHGLTRPGWRGAWLLGAAASLKFYPLLYVLRYPLGGEYRQLLRVAVTCIVIGVMAPLLLLGVDTTLMLTARAIHSSISELGVSPGVASQTLAELVDKFFAPGLVPGTSALVFELPDSVRGVLRPVLSLSLVGVSVYRLRGRATSDRFAAITLLLAFAIVLRPAWVHYFVILPVAQAELLGNRRSGTASRLLFALSFATAALPVVAFLANPDWFYVGQRVGVTTVSALLCLVGLLQLAPERRRQCGHISCRTSSRGPPPNSTGSLFRRAQ